MRSTKPRVIELFAGAGLFGHAFQESGFRLVRAVELDAVAASTYAANLGNHIEVADVRTVKPTGACEVLIAGPPCQGFSTLGLRNADDPRNDLSLEVVKWARVLTPRVIVIENVAAFLRSATWPRLERRLRRLGYDVTAIELDAMNYGVAQTRRRSFTIASINGKLPSLPKPHSRRFTVEDAWDALPSKPDGHNQHYAPTPSKIARARMRLIPPGGDKRDVMRRAPKLAPPSWFRLACEVTDAWGRMEWDKASNTLRTSLQNASKGRYIHPEQDRVISLREAARLHSIPDSFAFEGLPTQIARQIGNSVPPGLGRVVAREVLKIL